MLYVGDTKYKVYCGDQKMDLKTWEYTPCNYIENPSNAYIDTGYIIKNTTSAEVKFQYTTVKAQSYIFSNSGTWEAIFAFYTNGKTHMAYSAHNSVYYKDTAITPNTNIHTIKLGPCSAASYAYYDNTSFSYTAGTRKNEQLRLFQSVGGYGPGLAKIYYAKFYENGNLVLDFIPVKRISDGKYGLYDRINHTFNISPNGVDFLGG